MVTDLPIAIIVPALGGCYIFRMILNGLFLKAPMRSTSLSVFSSQHLSASLHNPSKTLPLSVSCSLFPAGGLLPYHYRYNASNTNPPLRIKGLPHQARSLLVLLEHRDAPLAARTHWICWDLPPILEIETNEQRGIHGRNDFLINGYTGPLCLPLHGSFCFVVFALRRSLHLPKGASRYAALRLLPAELLAIGELPFYA